MLASLGRANLRERSTFPGSERTTGTSQQDSSDANPVQVGRPRSVWIGQTLENRVVLAIDGKKTRSAVYHCIHEQTACHDQSFLVGQ